MSVCSCILLLGSCGKKETPGPVPPPSPSGPNPVSPELQQRIEKLNAGLVTLRNLIGAVAHSEVSALQEGAQGTRLVFRDGTDLTVECDAAASGAPLIGVAADEGAYYWTRASEKDSPYLSDADGKRIPVDGPVPVLGVDDGGYWTLTLGSGAPIRIVDASGAAIPASGELQPSLFRSVVETDGRVEIALTDGGRLSALRVTDLSAAGRANCYMVSAPGRYAFDAKLRGNGVGDAATTGFDPKIEITGDMEADWLWTDREGLVSEVGLDRASGEILFTLGEGRGNTLIALLRGGSVVWSWHIWATEAPQSVEYASGAHFMDRNLGASGTTVGGTEAYGLYYQWGRKDPFYGGEKTETSSTAFAEAKRLTRVNPNHAAVEWKIEKQSVAPEVAAAAPLTFYSAKVGTTDTYDWSGKALAGLWGAAKTLNDPCPPGYKVPEITAWEGICASNNYVEGISAWDDPNFGMSVVFGGRTDWYPAQGYRFHSFGSIAGLRSSNGGSGYYWSSTAAGRKSRNLFFRRQLTTSSGSLNLSLDNFRSAGYCVRCCRE